MTRGARLVLAAIALAAACATPPRAPDRPIVVAVRTSPANLDPGIGVDDTSLRVDQLVFSSLLRIDERLEVVPDLAVRFETEDDQTFVAEIPPGVRFHDGREMTADDVAFTFRRFLDPAFVSAKKGAYRDLASVDVVDRYTVAFHLHAPTPSFPVNLVMGIVPEGTGAEASRAPIGSGPYRVTAFAPDDHVTLERFDGYYRGPARNSGIVLEVIPDDTMRGLELRKGDVDLVVNDMPPDLIHSLSGEPNLQMVTAPGTDWAYLGLNLRDDALADRRVRQAIGYGIDTEAIASYLRRGLARPTAGVVPDMSWAHADDAFQFTHDPDRARALLEEAGYRDPDGPGPEPRLRLTLKTSTAEESRLQATVIQQQLAEAGIAIDLRSYEFATLMADVLRGNVQLYLLQFTGVSDPDMLRRLYHSSQMPPNGFNRGRYASADADALIDRATTTLDPAVRLAAYQEAQRVIARDAPLISLWAKTNVVIAQDEIRGIALSPLADFRFLSGVYRAEP